MWLIYAIIGGIATALGMLIAKKVVEDIDDPWMRSFYFSTVTFILVLPFFLYELSLPKNLGEVALILVTSAALVLGNYFNFKSYNYLNTSSISIISKLRLVWVALVGVLLLSQVLSPRNFIGMILVLLASIIIIDYKQWKNNYKGTIAVIISTITFAVYAFTISTVAKDIKPFSLLFFLSVTPAIMNGIVIKDWKKKVVKTYKKTKRLLIAAFFGTVFNMCVILGVREEPTKVFFVLEASVLLIVIGEYFWMKDKKNIWIKIISGILAIIGAILLR